MKCKNTRSSGKTLGVTPLCLNLLLVEQLVCAEIRL